MGDTQYSVADTAPTLRRGQHDPWVRYLQQMLEAARIPGLHIGAIGELFNAETEAAVLRFQAFASLPQTGVVDHETWARLTADAEQREQDDTNTGHDVGARDADETKLDTGEEVGHSNWRQVTVACEILDFRHLPFPDSTCYVRFVDANEQASDCTGVSHDGVLHLPDVWVPNDGHFHLYLESHQLSVHGGSVGTVVGETGLKHEGNAYIAFEAVQTPGDSRSMTFMEATAYGFTSTSGHDAGISLGSEGNPAGLGFDVKTGISSSTSSSDQHTYSDSDTVTVQSGSNGLAVTQKI
jgi:hypothetical protein